MNNENGLYLQRCRQDVGKPQGITQYPRCYLLWGVIFATRKYEGARWSEGDKHCLVFLSARRKEMPCGCWGNKCLYPLFLSCPLFSSGQNKREREPIGTVHPSSWGIEPSPPFWLLSPFQVLPGPGDCPLCLHLCPSIFPRNLTWGCKYSPCIQCLTLWVATCHPHPSQHRPNLSPQLTQNSPTAFAQSPQLPRSWDFGCCP